MRDSLHEGASSCDSNHLASNGWITDKMELIWKDAVAEYSVCYNENAPKKLKETTKIKILSHNSRCSSRDSSQELPEIT
jgi:hypothetical protein